VTLPTRPGGGPVTPRVVGLRKGSEGWLATLTARLPYTVDPPRPRPEGLRDYRAVLARSLTDGRIVGDEATDLAAAAGRAGLTQSTAWQVHEEFLVVHRAHAEADGVVTAVELRELQRAARELATSHLIRDLEEAAAAQRARREAPLRGWRILPVGDSPQLTEAVDAAVEQGARVAVKLTRTVRLVVTDRPETDPRLARARELEVPVLDVPQARALFDQEAAGGGEAPVSAVDDPGEGATGPRWHEYWRPRELTPAEYRDRYGGTIAAPLPAPVAGPAAPEEPPPARPAVGRSMPVLAGAAPAKGGCAVLVLLGGVLLAGVAELARHLVT
jgi:DNA polymerase-3 subunit epsilon